MAVLALVFRDLLLVAVAALLLFEACTPATFLLESFSLRTLAGEELLEGEDVDLAIFEPRISPMAFPPLTRELRL